MIVFCVPKFITISDGDGFLFIIYMGKTESFSTTIVYLRLIGNYQLNMCIIKEAVCLFFKSKEMTV